MHISLTHFSLSLSHTHSLSLLSPCLLRCYQLKSVKKYMQPELLSTRLAICDRTHKPTTTSVVQHVGGDTLPMANCLSQCTHTRALSLSPSLSLIRHHLLEQAHLPVFLICFVQHLQLQSEEELSPARVATPDARSDAARRRVAACAEGIPPNVEDREGETITSSVVLPCVTRPLLTVHTRAVDNQRFLTPPPLFPPLFPHPCSSSGTFSYVGSL